MSGAAGGCLARCWTASRKWRPRNGVRPIASPLRSVSRWALLAPPWTHLPWPGISPPMPRASALPTSCPFPSCESNRGGRAPLVHRHASHRTKAGPRARRRCLVCGRTYSATTGTPYARNRRPQAHFDRVIQMHSEGMTKAAIARVMRVSPSTVTRWISKAAAHARHFHDRHTRIEDPVEVQLDELSCRGSGRAKGAWVF
ncbi:MAG: helix-turn-helix domain-containing protein, partial [Planctomycetota bacterium]